MNLDIIIVVLYLVFINFLGIRFSSNKNFNDYFLGGRSIPWLIACFSIVATETSTLTFISIPGLSYITGMGFIQVTFGYLIGRIIVALILIPKYFEGQFQTGYEFIQSKFGRVSKKIISIIFHITRLLSDCVRLFATAIPLSIVTGWDYWISILVIGLATFIYTFYGGLRSVVVVDSIQLFLYIASAIVGMIFIFNYLSIPTSTFFERLSLENARILSTGFENGIHSLFGSYNIVSGIIGGAFLSFASHGTDHLMVQRVLSCKNTKSAKKAMVFSGVIIIFQFALFLLFGLFIKVLFDGKSFEQSDTIIPYFIVNYLPAGLKGLMLAGIFGAAMSTLSSSINSLSASTSVDILEIGRRNLSGKRKITISRIISFIWALFLIGISLLLQDTKNPLVEIGLSIASITYGGMMGIFFLGLYFENFHEKAAIFGVIASIVVNLYVAFQTEIFWLWYVVIGFIFSAGLASIINLFFVKKEPK